MVIRDEIWLKDILVNVENQMRENSLEGFKSVLTMLVKDSIEVLENMRKEYYRTSTTHKLNEEFNLLHHHLEYLKRFLEGIPHQ